MPTEIFETIAVYPKHLACPFFINQKSLTKTNSCKHLWLLHFCWHEQNRISNFPFTNKSLLQNDVSPVNALQDKQNFSAFFWAGTLLRTKISGQVLLFHCLSYLLRAQVVWGRYNLIRRYPSWELTYPLKRQFWVDDFPFPSRWDMASFPRAYPFFPFGVSLSPWCSGFSLSRAPSNSERSFAH